LYIAYVGDSRIYLLRGRRIQQISRDHTWVQDAMEKGILDKNGIKNHPNLHVIRRYLGSNEPAEPDLRLFLQPGESDKHAKENQGLALSPGDVILLCTDGLTDLVSDSEILNMLPGRKLKEVAQALIDLACQRGGHDNITVVLLGVPWDPSKSDPGWVPG
jgi:protein phosphatase